MKAGLRVGFQGEPGAFSEEAVLALLPMAAPVPHRTFRDVVTAVESGSDDAGLLPVENTLAGSVTAAFDALHAGHVHVVGEVVIPIRHFLMGLPGTQLSQIVEAHSHPVALAQCERFFQAHPKVIPVAVHDTAGAARQVAQAAVAAVAAIAPRQAAYRYGLTILAEDLQDRDDNQTRFLLILRGAEPKPDADQMDGDLKTALIAETENRPGALHRLLGVFAQRGLDLTHVESRPAGTPWTYRFILEFRHGSRSDAAHALAAAEAMCRHVRVLGTYLVHT